MKTPPLILIADDYPDNVELLEQRLEQAGYRTTTAADGAQALRQVEALRPDLLLLDIVMPGMGGIEVIAALRGCQEYQDLPIIVLSARIEVEDRVAGLDAGADEYLPKPIEEAELLARVRAMLRLQEAVRAGQRLEAENQRLRQEIAAREGFGEVVGQSAPMQEVYGLIQKVAQTAVSVLITGESGTGKELVGRAIHRQSPRREGPFVAINCGALPETLLEAELFGHKRGSFTGAQADRFREDLYFRLNVIPIRLPPLRQRREDILPLAEHFLQRHCQRQGRPLPALSPGARRLLLDYEWPGNVRELEHEMERVLTLGEPGEPVGPELLSEEVRGVGEPIRDELPGRDGTLKGRMEQVERRFLEEALGQNNWNQTRTAEVLGLTRQGLIKKLQRYGIRGRGGE